MCMPVSRDAKYFQLEPTYAWKVVGRKYKWQGPWKYSVPTPDGWAKQVYVRTHQPYGRTGSGYHVFQTKEGATAYRFSLSESKRIAMRVQRVRVKGRAIEFTWTMGYRTYRGWAVTTWR